VNVASIGALSGSLSSATLERILYIVSKVFYITQALQNHLKLVRVDFVIRGIYNYWDLFTHTDTRSNPTALNGGIGCNGESYI